MAILPDRLETEILPLQDQNSRFSRGEDPVPEARIRLLDPETGRTWGFVVIDDTRRGPGLGGIRMAPDVSLNEVGRLARAMTLKNSAANLPFGGAKAGLLFDPRQLEGEPGLRRDLIALLAEALFPLDRYIPAPDMGTDERDIQQIYEVFSRHLGTLEHMRGGASRPHDKGGIPIDAWGLTAHSLFASIRSLERLDPEFRLEGAQVVIQGFGNVGSMTAMKLAGGGALIAGASDIHGGLWQPGGLDVQELDAVRHRPGGILNYSGPVERRFSSEHKDWLLEAPCDLLIPAARPDALTARNADRIQCRMIFQGANAPSNKMTEYYLQNRRGIPSFSDFIVNVGGVMGCAVELHMTVDPAFRKRVLDAGGDGRNYIEARIEKTVSSNMETLWRRWREGGGDGLFRERALELAKERLQNCGTSWL